MYRDRGSVRTVLLIGTLPLLVSVLFAPTISASPAETGANAYIDSLLDRARGAGLSEDPYWRTLVHYKGGICGLRSLVDDPRFFLAADGKHDPEAELEATIRALFEPASDGEKHPVCRFVARYDWLARKLDIDESRLPVPRCAPFDETLDQIRPESVTLIFPTSHMNSPASMYGHTLLTIRPAGESDLLSYAVNYSAVTDETFGLFYIVKGLVGRYKGYFSILPYYAKLQEYSDVNDRDIWEYPLDLTTDEIRRLLMHVYEMQDIYADYYFFNENCSYDLLFLLDAARPGLHLTDQCGWWVIPLDTIRAIKKSGLVRGAVYRPSKSTKVKHLASLLPASGRRDALAIAKGRLEPGEILERSSTTEEKIRICDLAGEYLQYVYAKKDLAKEQYVGRFMKTLKARSDLGATGGTEDRGIPAPTRPDEGHHSNRLSLGFGFDDDRPFQELRLRPAYHDLLDNDPGYKRGSQIVFLDIVLRYHPRDERVRLEALDLIDIVSIAPRDDFFKHTSWKIRTDLFRRAVRKDKDALVYRLNPGFGRAHENRLLGLWYVMIETDLHVGGALDGGYSAGAGASCGLLRNLTGSWKIHLFAGDIDHMLGDRDNDITAGFGQNIGIGPDMSVSVEVLGERNDHDSRLESVVRWNAFF